MSKLFIGAGVRTPQITFSFEDGVFSLEGESYPEDVRAFYDDPMAQFYAWLESNSAPLRFEFKLVYFNSSTAKVIMDLMERLEEAAGNGRECLIQWHYAEDDDNIKELGEEFAEDLVSAKFELVEVN
jgi:hypothetical protein